MKCPSMKCPRAKLPYTLGLGLILVLTTSVTAGELEEAVRGMPPRHHDKLASQLALAGDNQAELLAAIREVPPEHREALCFLLVHMPPRDLKSLGKEFLLGNIRYAYKARAGAPWGRAVSDELFFHHVLPYANINERRDDWRKDFYERFHEVAWKCRTPAEAVSRLNKYVFDQLKVEYHPTKRRKPQQSPYESIELRYASCTGLSILLIDACRAVGIPARMVGTPLLSNFEGNHTWVEIWDRHWHFIDAWRPEPMDKTYFFGIAAKADPMKPRHRIYAVSFTPTATHFPMVWSWRVRDVPADDVTCFYTTRRNVTFRIGKARRDTPGMYKITVRLDGKLVAEDTVRRAASFPLAGNRQYDVRVRSLDGSDEVTRRIALTAEDNQVIDFTPGKSPVRGE